MKDLKPAPKGAPIRINDLLDKFGLGDAFDELLFQQGKALGFKADAKAEAYIFSKLDELKAHVTANKIDTSTNEELKGLISDWLEAQTSALEKELNDEWIKTLEEETA